MNKKDYNDYELLSYIKESNEEALNTLYEKYKPLIEQNAARLINYSKYAGLDKNDLIQEGLLGLNNAIKTFDDNKEASFYTYARACIERKQLTAVIGSQRDKHKFLNESLSFEVETEDEVLSLDNVLGDNEKNPENILTEIENMEELKKNILSYLTKLEKHVFELKINGYTYVEIAGMLDISKKQVDNAISRIKAKIREIIDNKAL